MGHVLRFQPNLPKKVKFESNSIRNHIQHTSNNKFTSIKIKDLCTKPCVFPHSVELVSNKL